MQQPQSRPLLGDSVSSTTSPTTRRNNNPVAVLTPQQLQQLQQLQSQNSGPQSVTFTLQQPSGNNQEQPNGSAAGNHILYVNQLNQLNQGPLNPSGTGMGLPQATPTFGVGLNMGLPLSLLNTSLTSLTSNAITTSNSLLNLSLPSINSGLTAINPSINQLSTLGTNLVSNLSSDSINNGLSNLGQDLSSINSGMGRLGALNSTNINTGLTNTSAAGLASVNPTLTNLNATTINQNLASINANLTVANSAGTSALNPTLNTSISLSNNNINSGLNQQGLNRSLSTITNLNSTSSSAQQFPFQTIQGVQSIASNLVGSNIVSSSASQNQSSNVNSTVQPASSNSSSNVSSTCASSSSGPIIATSVTTTNVTPSNNQQINVAQFEIMTSNMSNVLNSQVNDSSTNPSITAAAFRQFTNQNLNQTAINSPNQVQNAIISNMKTVQGIQNQPNTSPSSPFSIPMKSPASNIAPPTPSPSPNRFMLRSPASNSVQSRNSPSPVSTSQSNTSFNVQLQSPMQSPISVGQIHSPVPSPYPPAKSPHLLGVGAPINNKSPAPGGSPGPSVVRPSTPIVQQGMQVLQIIHGTQGYQAAPQLVTTRTHLFGNQQIQIATPAKPNKQPPQILPKPPLQQTTNINQQKQRVTTTVTNQVTQQSQPQIVLAGPQPNPPTATMIPTAQGLLLNQLTQQQLVRVVTAQGMQLQGITPTFFAVPNGFSSPAPPVIRHAPSSPAPSTNPNTNSGIVVQNTMVQNSQSQMAQSTAPPTTTIAQTAQAIIDSSLLPPPKKKAKKKKRAKKKEDEQPKLDLASIMKISGIGDDDDIFDNDLTTEMETTPQPQGEMNIVQNSLAAMPNSCVQQNVVQVPTSSTSNVLQANATQDNLGSGQLVAQLEAPPQQNTISGHLRLAIDESGRIVLHHTLDPNQPEMDQATAQALIKSLTQSGGQNSQIISQLLQAQTMIQTSQNSQNSNVNRPKPIKSPVPTTLNTGPPSSNSSNIQNSTAVTNSQLVTSNSLQNFNNYQPILTVQNPSIQSTTNLVSQNVGQSAKNITVTRKIIDAKKPPTAVDVKSSVVQKANVQSIQSGSNRMCSANQQQSSNVQVVKCNQTKIQNTCININQQQSHGKQVEIQIQKSEQNCANIQRTLTTVKGSPQGQAQQASCIQESGLFLPQNSIIYHQNASHQQIPISQPQNIQNMFEQNLQQSLGSTLQRTSTDGIKIETVNIGQQISSNPQQQTLNLFQQNTDANMSSENNLQFINDVQISQQQNAQLNANNAKQQIIKPLNTNSNQSIDMQNLSTNVFISNSSAPTLQPQEQPKAETHNLCNLSTPATAVINNGPKITPDILNALSNLNPNDQLLIAYANGQMQVMSQQVLQQFITSQINTQMQAKAQTQAQGQTQTQAQSQAQPQIQTQTQSQTQKIVIGDPDSNNSNLQEVQINTPTSQIIVNSSGGAPTIQNNIQNIVVQAAPTQVPQQIQIQNSGFPSQFIDNLNQQQIRNLGNCTAQSQSNNQNINQSSAPKKPKIVKKAKVLTTTTTTTALQSSGKILNVSKPLIVTSTVVTTTTTTTTSASSQVKSEPPNKMINFLAQVVDSNKNESPQLVTVNGPLTALSPGQMPTLAPGQVVHRVQTIQLSAQKQQLLSSNQAQIRTLQARKNLSQADQLMIAKLFQEQARILASGKIIGNSQHPISSDSESASLTINAPPTVLCSNTISQNVAKNPSLTGQPQTPTSACPSNITTSQHIHIATSLPVSSSNIYLPSITNQRVSSPRPSTPLKSQLLQQPQQNQNQVENGQMLVPSNANMMNVDSLNSHGLMLESQQLMQCHDDAIDVKSNVELTGPIIKQETTSIQQQQIQNASPAGQVISPRVTGKVMQISQSKMPSPDNPSTSPKQGVKRTSDSTPVSRQINRTDLFEQQLKIDQNGALNPDVNTPFQSKSDACKRLVRYHCFNDHVLSTKDLEKADEIFEETAKHLLSKFNSMMNKYTYLLIMESMRETRTSELMMIDRMIVNEEQATLNKLKEQEAKLAVELKSEEKLLVPKTEPNDEETASTSFSMAAMSSSSSSSMTTPSAPVKLELEMEVGLGKSADYDEWFEIQKELGAYTSTEFKCRTKTNRVERARANGEVRGMVMGNEASASDLERDLLEDTEGLESLALYTQSQCPVQSMERGANPDDHDDITAQVQSAIDSILSLKKRPSVGASQQQSGGSSSSSSDSNDKLLDQAVRSILGS
ncbi:serine-rich adhesin for platelets-like isoform X2 [Phymastichus coffea]|uniref:serine-rich adhesin for platelets-like isoform X2 n=1 Tax=Phymastichus coffea TaxID=108790 RepID=UPI00273AD4A5|nr:serine-rich adhesin for platelets-like isoform X2 [Phymastichus coffea]